MTLKADSTHTIRLPAGVARKLRAATGQPLSRLFRYIALELVAKYETSSDVGAVDKVKADVRDTVQQTQLPETHQ